MKLDERREWPMRQRHNLYLSKAFSERLELMAETHRLSKSEILERALQAYLTQDAGGSLAHPATLQQERNERTLGRLERDVAIATELLATFVRYFLTITPPLPASETDAARALGRQRFEQVIAGIARRLKTDKALVRRVLDMLEPRHRSAPTAHAIGADPFNPLEHAGNQNQKRGEHR